MRPFTFPRHPKVTTWSEMIPLLEFDWKLETYLIRLFSHTGTRRFHSLCLTDSFLMIPLPRVPRGTRSRGHSASGAKGAREGKDEMKAGARWTRATWIYQKKALNVSFLSNHFSWAGRLHSSHMPQGCTGCSHFEAHLPIFACSTFCNNEETGSKCLLHSSHIQRNFTGGRTYWKEREQVVIERANIEWPLFSSRIWKELVSNRWTAVGITRCGAQLITFVPRPVASRTGHRKPKSPTNLCVVLKL